MKGNCNLKQGHFKICLIPKAVYSKDLEEVREKQLRRGGGVWGRIGQNEPGVNVRQEEQ